MQQVIHEMAESEPGGFFHRSTGMEREIRGHEKVAHQAGAITYGIGQAQPHAMIHKRLQGQVDAVMDDSGHSSHHAKTQELKFLSRSGEQFLQQPSHTAASSPAVPTGA